MLISVLAGIGIAAGIVFGHRRWQNSHWSIPVVIFSLPTCYLLFAILASDDAAIYKEFVVGMPLFIIAYLSLKHFHAYLLLAACALIAHGFYDIYHDLFFINHGTPFWFPWLCFTVDIALGIFVIYLWKTNWKIN